MIELKDLIATVEISTNRINLIAKQGGYLTTLEFGYLDLTTATVLSAQLVQLINKNAMENKDE